MPSAVKLLTQKLAIILTYTRTYENATSFRWLKRLYSGDKFNEILKDFYLKFFQQKRKKNEQNLQTFNYFLFDDLVNCIRSHLYWQFETVLAMLLNISSSNAEKVKSTNQLAFYIGTNYSYN